MIPLALHPLCELFPRMSEAEFSALKADIAANKLNQAIVTHGGKILDGGNRYRACVELGIEPRTVEYTGTDPVAFVLSANLHRRHLTPGQQAAIVASAQDWAKARSVGNPQFGNVTGLATVADRAATSGASDKTQRNADKVARAAPELAKLVAHGEISLPQAVRQVEKKPKLAASPEPAIEPEPDPADDLIADYEREVAENNRLRERIEAITKADLAAEVDSWSQKYAQLEGRLQQAITTANEAAKQAQRQGKLLRQIRECLGVDRDSEILPALKGGAK